MEIELGKEVIINPAGLLDYEWLDTNQLGGYSSSTLSQCHTRKYHGLLVANLINPTGKYVLLSKLDDALCEGEKEILLSTHRYRNYLQENGSIYLKKFLQETHPSFIFQCETFTLIKEILMQFEENTVFIKYTLLNGSFDKVRIKPLIAYRNIHTLTFSNQEIQTTAHPCKQGYKLTPYHGLPDLYFQTDSPFTFLPYPDWYKNFEYVEENKRGFADCEDLFTPGSFLLSFNTQKEIIFSCSDVEQNLPLSELWKKEIKRRKGIIKKTHGNFLQKTLKKTAYSFINKQPKLNNLMVTAGYHWFNEWGRDTLVALPGLTLYSNDETKFLSILKNLIPYEKNGLLPNIISSEISKCSYNSVDISLWFAWALQQYYYKTNDIESIKQFFWPTLLNIYTHYTNGTLNNIKVGPNEILYAGNHFTNVTWMDAMIAGVPVTPRHGAQVEINALWYNFLCFIDELSQRFNESIDIKIKSRIKQLKKSFSTVFWDEKLGYLRDYVNEEEINNSIRPNQIFSVSLPYSPLTKRQALSVVGTVTKHLLTPYGLRTLSPLDKNYIGRYGGDVYSRDFAYHNGSVWPWLLAPFAEALLKVSSSKKNTLEVLQPCLTALQKHLYAAGLGTISEIFDGNYPHHPNGCISQAWNIAEVIRLTYLINRDKKV